MSDKPVKIEVQLPQLKLEIIPTEDGGADGGPGFAVLIPHSGRDTDESYWLGHFNTEADARAWVDKLTWREIYDIFSIYTWH